MSLPVTNKFILENFSFTSQRFSLVAHYCACVNKFQFVQFPGTEIAGYYICLKYIKTVNMMCCSVCLLSVLMILQF